MYIEKLYTFVKVLLALQIFYFLFLLLQIFCCTLVSTSTDYLNHKNDLLKKKLKVSNNDMTEIIESCSQWKYTTLFLRPYW